MPTHKLTLTIEGDDLHVREGSPADFGIETTPKNTSTIKATYNGEDLEVWFVGIDDHPKKKAAINYGVASMGDMLKRIGVPLATDAEISVLLDIPRGYIGDSSHFVVRLSNLID